MALRLRRGTDAERLTIIPLQGELIYTTDTKKLYVGDGAEIGGVLVGPVDSAAFDLVNDENPQLGGDLDLNGNNIVGVGNINIDGTITATGNIGLGDEDSDEITVGGVINSSLRPSLDNTYDLGTQSRNWRNVWSTQVNVNTTLAIGDRIVKLDEGSEDSSFVLWDAITDTVSATSIRGDLTGSVLSDDSSVMFIDADGFKISNGTITLNNDTIESNSEILNISSESVTINADVAVLRKTGVDDTLDNMAFNAIESSRTLNDQPVDVQNGDFLGSFAISGYENNDFVSKVLIVGSIDEASINNPLPGKILFGLHDANGDFKAEVSINSRHHLITPVTKFTPFADTTARDTALPNDVVEAGMVIYLQSTNKLQVNTDGTTDGWTDLN